MSAESYLLEIKESTAVTIRIAGLAVGSDTAISSKVLNQLHLKCNYFR